MESAFSILFIDYSTGNFGQVDLPLIGQAGYTVHDSFKQDWMVFCLFLFGKGRQGGFANSVQRINL